MADGKLASLDKSEKMCENWIFWPQKSTNWFKFLTHPFTNVLHDYKEYLLVYKNII